MNPRARLAAGLPPESTGGAILRATRDTLRWALHRGDRSRIGRSLAPVYPYRLWLHTVGYDAVRSLLSTPSVGSGSGAPHLHVLIGAGPGRSRTVRSVSRQHRVVVHDLWRGVPASVGEDEPVVEVPAGSLVRRGWADAVLRHFEYPAVVVVGWDSDRRGDSGILTTTRPAGGPVIVEELQQWGTDVAVRAGVLRSGEHGDAVLDESTSRHIPAVCIRHGDNPVVPDDGPVTRWCAAMQQSGPSTVTGSSIARDRTVSVIVPTRGSMDLLERLFDGLERTVSVGWSNLEVIVIDNAERTDELDAFYRDWSDRLELRVVHRDPSLRFNYSATNNVGINLARGEILAFLNDDLEIPDPGWLDGLVAHLDRPGVGVVGPLLTFAEGTVQHAGVVVGLGGLADHIHRGLDPDTPVGIAAPREVRCASAVTGACMVTTREVAGAIGGFEERLVLTGSDVWFCLQAQRVAGLRTMYVGTVEVIHHESVSRGSTNHVVDVELSRDLWHDMLVAGDPRFSPLLDVRSLHPRLRVPSDLTPLALLDEWLTEHAPHRST